MLFHYVFFNMGDPHLVLTALNLSTLNAGILIMMFSLNRVNGGLLHVLPVAVCMSFFAGQVGGTTLNLSYSLSFLWDPSFMLKSYRVGWGGGVVAHEN